MAKSAKTILHLDGHEVTISNPHKIYFRELGITKLELVQYYLAVAEGALRGVARRPMIMKRFVNGIEEEPFYQKRAPPKRPDWIEIATFTFPSGRHADEIAVENRAQLAYVVNLGCVDLNPHAVRREHMDHPDELRIDLDPVPGIGWAQIVDVARVAKQVLDEHGLVGWPKTSGSRGAHVWVRIPPRWPFATVRRAGLALAREVERRAPEIATARWWKEERRGVFLDYNQNARDRTTASAYSVRANQEARVSMPLSWDDFFRCDPHDYTLRTVPVMFAAHGDAHARIDETPCSLESLLALADRQEEAGEADAPQRTPKVPVITIANAKQKAAALAGLERWKQRHPAIVAKLAPEDIIVDTNRGRATAWYRIRINLKNVPAEEHPPTEPPDPDYDWKTEWTGA
ncbi:MAG: DNA polymerase domain-containing protein [Deltaproteobacteria bacterium]|nr:DNA polymerase domain-containing protein [Deltaproteobacteria bacterium]